MVPLGVDTLDSCNPTRLGRHGSLLTRDGPIRITVMDSERYATYRAMSRLAPHARRTPPPLIP